MVVGVGIYVMMGAYTIRRIEARRISDHDSTITVWGRKGFKTSRIDAHLAENPSRSALKSRRNIPTSRVESIHPCSETNLKFSVALPPLRDRGNAENCRRWRLRTGE